MKSKSIVSVIFLFSFSIYLLCPLLMQGNCGFSLVDASLTGEAPSCSKCSNPCHTDTDPAPQQEKPHVGSCCFVGMELTRPNEADALDLSKRFRTAFSLNVVLPSLFELLPSHQIARKPRPFLHLYGYFHICQTLPRAPPRSPLAFS